MRAEKYLRVTPPQEQKPGLAPNPALREPSVQPETKAKGCRAGGQAGSRGFCKPDSGPSQPQRTEPNSVQTGIGFRRPW